MDLLRFIAVCCLAFCTGCSIKEYRESCPCVLKLDISEVDVSVVKVADLFISGPEGYELADTLTCGGYDGIYEVEVPKGELGLWMYSGAGREYVGDGGLVIPYGEDCPPVYMHVSKVQAYGEEVTEKVSMKKNHCVLNVIVRAEEVFPLRLEFKGKVSGYDDGGEPLKGEFMYSAEIGPENSCRVLLPRQVDDSLVLDIIDGTEVVKVFALGEHIAATGYDWSEKDLKDMTLEIDFILSRFSIVVPEWDEVIVFDVCI